MRKPTYNTLGDLVNPEVKNILKKFARLGFLTEEMGIAKERCQDLKYLSDLSKYKDHKYCEEAKNLVSKLTKIQKK